MEAYIYELPGAELAGLHSECEAAGLPVSHVNGTGDFVYVYFTRDMTPQEEATLEAVANAHDGDAARYKLLIANAKEKFADAKDEMARRDRAIALVALDEINLLRQRLRAQDQAVANATSLADLKARWATLPAVPDRTVTQARNAVLARIDTPDAD